jgi:hypothetical protein
MDNYRVRAAVVAVCNHNRCWNERRFIAEHRVSFLFVFFLWRKVGTGWRPTVDQARDDIYQDIDMRSLLPAPISHQFEPANNKETSH